jgi:hypothetical protein
MNSRYSLTHSFVSRGNIPVWSALRFANKLNQAVHLRSLGLYLPLFGFLFLVILEVGLVTSGFLAPTTNLVTDADNPALSASPSPHLQTSLLSTAPEILAANAADALLFEAQNYSEVQIGAPNDQTGYAVALSADGKTAFIGSFGANNNRGKVTILSRPNVNSVYTVTQILTASNEAVDRRFGFAIALSKDGNTALIGAVGAGSTYVFTRNGAIFVESQILTPSNRSNRDGFGYAVTLSDDGSIALIGAATKNNDQGVAYIFTRNGGSFSQSQILTNSDAGQFDRFGGKVALNGAGDLAVIGASSKNNAQGAAYVFTRTGTTFNQSQILTNTNPTLYDYFGEALALASDGNTLLIGAPGRSYQGGVDLYIRGATGFVLSQSFVAADTTVSHNFGRAIALNADGTFALIGAYGRQNAQGAVYTFNRNGAAFVEGQALTASDATNKDYFGNAVAFSSDGNVVLIGANEKNDKQGKTYFFTRNAGTYSQSQTYSELRIGVSGDALGNAVVLSTDGNTALVGASGKNNSQGMVFVFSRPNAAVAYTVTQIITASNGSSQDKFGKALAVSADGMIALVGAPGKNNAQGTVYPFVRQNGRFVQLQPLTAFDAANDDNFGNSVALSGDGNTALIGAYSKNNAQGAVYVSTRTGESFSLAQPISISNAPNNLSFGISLALDDTGNTAVIGAYGYNTSQGAAYIYTRSLGSFIQSQILTASNRANYNYFGQSVNLSGDGKTVLVGAPNTNTWQGNAYIFSWNGISFSQSQILTASDGVVYDHFAFATSLSKDGNTALIGAFGRKNYRGAAYVFTRSAGSFSETQILTASNGVSQDFFGLAVALNRNGTVALIGAPSKNREQGEFYLFKTLCDPSVVTRTTDDGSGQVCGSFSAALKTVSLTQPLIFALTGNENIVTFTGTLVVAVPEDITLDGGSERGIVLNGNGVNGDGLRLSGNNVLMNLVIKGFNEREIVTLAPNNRLDNVRVLL